MHAVMQTQRYRKQNNLCAPNDTTCSVYLYNGRTNEDMRPVMRLRVPRRSYLPPPLRMPSISREKRSICPHPFCSIFSHERIFYRYFGYGYHLSSLTCPYIAHLSATLIPDLFCQQCSRAVRRSRSPLAVTRTAESNLAKHPFLVTIDDCHLSFSRAKGLGRLDRVWYIYGRTYSLS